jgi:membrane associated rhomboid family serine protease
LHCPSCDYEICKLTEIEISRGGSSNKSRRLLSDVRNRLRVLQFKAPAKCAVTLAVITINGAVYLLFRILLPERERILWLVRQSVHERSWQLLSAMWIHPKFTHLLGNMAFLWLFGRRLERIIGAKSFLLFYLICGICTSICSTLVYPLGVSYGSSGAVIGLGGGLIGVYGARFQTLTAKRKWRFVLLVLATSSFFLPDPYPPGVNYIGHAVGLITGLALSMAFNGLEYRGSL